MTKTEISWVSSLSARLKTTHTTAVSNLVCIAPQAQPPVCRAMDYGKYRYEQDKREKEQKKKQQTVEVKEVQLSCRIDKHDFDTKAQRAIKFLKVGQQGQSMPALQGQRNGSPGSGP